MHRRGRRRAGDRRGKPAAASAADKLKVGFIYLGPIGDFGWTYQHEVGRQEMVKDLGDKIETTYLENVSEGPDAERSIEQLARTGHKLIFTTSFGYMDPTLKVAKKYPKVHVRARHRLQDAPEHRDLFRPLLRRPLHPGPDRRQDVEDGRARLYRLVPDSGSHLRHQRDHARRADRSIPNIKVKIIWVNTWFDPGKEADAAKALLDQGADVLMQHTDCPAAMQIAASAACSPSARTPT